MTGKIGDPYYENIEIASRTLKKAFFNLDDDILRLELYIKELEKKNKDLEDKLHKSIMDTFNAQQANMAATLKACLGAPKLSDLGTVGSTVLIKIMHMETIDEIKAYVNEIVEESKKEEKENKEENKI